MSAVDDLLLTERSPLFIGKQGAAPRKPKRADRNSPRETEQRLGYSWLVSLDAGGIARLRGDPGWQ
jgi:hypothetical protein